MMIGSSSLLKRDIKYPKRASHLQRDQGRAKEWHEHNNKTMQARKKRAMVKHSEKKMTETGQRVPLH